MNNKNIKKDLLEFGTELNQSMELDFVLEKIIEEKSLSLLGTKRAALYLLNEEKELLIPQATVDPNIKKEAQNEPIPVNASLSGKVVKSKKGKIFNNASTSADAYKIPGTSDDEDENLLVLPLKIDNQVIGTINFYRDHTPYTEQELELGRIFSMYASMAVQNSIKNQQLSNELDNRILIENDLLLKNQVFDISISANSIADIDGKITQANDAFIKLWGYTNFDEVIGKSISDFIDNKKDADKIINILKKVGKWEGEYFAIRKDGSKFIAYGLATILTNKNKEILGYQSAVIDITNQKETEKKLTESRKLYKNVFNNSPDGILTVDKLGIITNINSTFEKLSGFKKEELVNKHFLKLPTLMKQDLKLYKSLIIDILKGKDLDSINFKWKNKKGEVKDGEGRVSLLWTDGKISGAQVITIDRTKQRKAENKLKESEQKFRSFYDNSPTAIYETDEKGKCLRVNKVWRKLSGLSNDEAKGDGWINAIHPDDRGFVLGEWKKFAKTGRDWKFEYRFKNMKTGKVNWVAGIAMPLKNSEGAITGYLGTNTIITDLKENEKSLVKNEEKFKKYFNDNLAGAFISTPSGQLIDCNQAFLDIAGYPNKKTALSTNVKKLYERGVNRTIKIDRLKKHKKINQLEEELIRYDGNKIYVVSNVWGEYDKNGELKTIQGYTQDISEKKEMTEKLDKLSKMYKDAQKLSKLGAWEFDIVTNNQIWTEEIFRILEFDVTDEAPKVPEGVEFIAPEFQSMAQKALEAVITKGISFDQEWEVVTQKGNKKWVRSVGKANKVQGNIETVSGSFQDITEQKKLEKSLHEAQTQGEIGSWEYSVENDLSTWSDQMYKIFDIAKNTKDLSWKNHKNWIHPDDWEEIDNKITNAASKGESYQEEFRIVDSKKNIKWAETRGLVHKDEAGKIYKLSGTVQDITKRKLVEEEIKESERTFSTFFNNDLVASYISTPKGKLIDCNQAYIDMMRYPDKETALSKTTYSIYPKNVDRDEKLNRLKNLRSLDQHDEKLVRYDGEIFTAASSMWGVYDGDELLYIQGLSQDISDRKEAEEDLINSETRFRLVAETANDLIYEWDIETDELKWFGDIDKALGYEKGEFPRTLKAWVSRIHTDDLEEVEKAIEKQRNSKGRIFIEYRIKRKDSSWRIWTDAGTVITDEAGKPIKQVGACTDVTDQKNAERELKRSEEKYKNVIEHSSQMFYIHDTNNVLSYVSPQSFELFGYKPQEMMENWTSFVTDNPINDEGFKITEETLKTGKQSEPYLLEIQRKDKEKRLVKVFESSLKDKNGNIIGLAGSLEDVTDFKKYEKELLEKNDRLELFATIFENLNECITVTDKDHKIFYVNKAFKKLYGFTEDEYLGKTVDFLRTDNDPEYLKKIKEATNNGGWAGEIVNRKKDGTIFPIELSTTRILDKEKNVIARIGIVKDITNRRDAEDKLIKSEKLNRSITNSAVDAIITIDSKGLIQTWNKSAEKILGYQASEVLDKSLSIIVPKQHKEGHSEGLLRLMSGGKEKIVGKTIEIEAIDKNKRIFPIELSLASWIASGKKYFTGIIRDISEKKKTEETLIIEQEKYRALVENSTDAIFMVDSAYTVTFVNTFGAKLLGTTVDTVVGSKISKLFPKEVVKLQKDIIDMLFSTGKVMQTESKIEFPQGKVWLDNVLIPVFDDDGHVISSIGVSRNISDKKRYEMELKEHRANLEELVKERTEELEEKNAMLDSSVKVFVGREQTIIKLKNKIKELEAQLEAAK